MKNKKQILLCALIFIVYCTIMFLSNYFMLIGVNTNDEKYEMISGILFGFIGIPVISIFLPLYLANKWDLDYSLWPKSKKSWYVILFIVMYIILTNYSSIKIICKTNYGFADYVIHYISTLLFHITYYPLFVILIFPLIRKNFGLWTALISTSVLFALYHLTQYHFFPAGTTPQMQIMLSIAFLFNILIYLWSESVILVSLLHSTNGAIGLLSNGTIFNQVDFLFYLTILIVISLFTYYIIREIKQRRNNEYNRNWWIHFNEIK